MRKILSLNYHWRYSQDYREEYIKQDFDDSGFQMVMLPHANVELPYNNFDEKLYQFVSCYRRSIYIGNEQSGKRALLNFEGVMTYAKVYFNGIFVGEHKGGYTPFKLDVTKHVNYDSENLIAVMVDSTERDDIPPFGFAVDYLTYGGIYREVSMEFVDPISVDNMFVRTKNILLENKLLDIDVYITNTTGKADKIKLIFSLGDLADNELLHFDQSVELKGGALEKINIIHRVGDVQLWSIDNPVLYNLSLIIVKQQEIIDDYGVRIGFRVVSFRNDGFYLNGERIKLRGVNRHQSFPYVGYAMPKNAQYRDVEILKQELGVNIVRSSHYPQSRHFMDRCDELGLLVFEEIPGWQHIGDSQWKDVAVKNVEEMIKRDWNRPSVVIWGVRINESQDEDVFYKKTNALAKMLDDTRPTGGVRNFEGSNLLEDVYTYNDFIHQGDNEPLHRVDKVTKNKVPFLVTEHNGHMFPTKKFDQESKRVEHALRHARVLNRMYEDHSISGAIGWCMFDYNTHEEFGNGDRICYHGVMDMFRIPKYAAAVYASQQEAAPVMEVLSSMNRGERDGSNLDTVYVFTNCDYIKLYRNKEYIGSYYPNREAFKGLPHPPILISDFVGNMIEKHESFSKRDADEIKELLFAVVKYGDKTLPLRYKLRLAKAMLRLKLSYDKAVELYTKYIANWGTKALEYEFVGYMNDKEVKSVVKGPSSTKDLMVEPDKLFLIEGDTYDVCRIVLKHLDQHGNIMDFSNEVLNLTIEGPGAIIGPSSIALISGSVAFWVKTTGGAGDIKIKISSERFDTKVVNLKVESR